VALRTRDVSSQGSTKSRRIDENIKMTPTSLLGMPRTLKVIERRIA